MLARRSAARGLLAAICVLSIISWAPQSTASSAAPPIQVVIEPDAGVTPLVNFIQGATHTLDGEIYAVSSNAVFGACKPPGAVM